MSSAGESLVAGGRDRQTDPARLDVVHLVAVHGRERKAGLQHAASVRVDPLRLRALPPTVLPGADASPQVAVMFAIGTKVGSAVVRNRIRRRLRAVVRECGSPLDGWSLMLTAGSAAAIVPFEVLRHAMDEAVQRVLRQRADRELIGRGDTVVASVASPRRVAER